jgi:hypothetical protein
MMPDARDSTGTGWPGGVNRLCRKATNAPHIIAKNAEPTVEMGSCARACQPVPRAPR